MAETAPSAVAPGRRRRPGSLRLRLLMLLGVAMVPPGLVAIAQATLGYRNALEELERNLKQSAQLAANEEENVFSASREILTSLAAQLDVQRGQGTSCRLALSRAIAGLGQYAGAAVLDANARVTCTTLPGRVNGTEPSTHDWAAEVLSGDSAFVISDLIPLPPYAEWGIAASSPLVERAEDGEATIRGAVVLFVGLTWLEQLYGRAPLPEQSAFGLVDRQGTLISGGRRPPGQTTRLPSAALIAGHLQNERTFTAVGGDGTERIYALSPLLQDRIFVVLGIPTATAIGPLTTRFAVGIMAPLVLWAIAIAVVWIGIEVFVVRWIDYLERLATDYAAGKQQVRPLGIEAAPAEIRHLGQTFAQLADLVAGREAQLRASLAQKDLLVREVHHRVKNNLQLVMSLLNLQARKIRDPRAEAMFVEARARINALASLHRRLYESDNVEEIDLKWFFEDLCGELRRGAQRTDRRVMLEVIAPSLAIGTEIAVPLGLLVTEAVTNAYKHAFTGRESGRIRVCAEVDENGRLGVCVSDDGVGYRAQERDAAAGGLGRPLIEALARQLAAELVVTVDQGTQVCVRLPLQSASAAPTATLAQA